MFCHKLFQIHNLVNITTNFICLNKRELKINTIKSKIKFSILSPHMFIFFWLFWNFSLILKFKLVWLFSYSLNSCCIRRRRHFKCTECPRFRLRSQYFCPDYHCIHKYFHIQWQSLLEGQDVSDCKSRDENRKELV